jgi:hypothetical protein
MAAVVSFPYHFRRSHGDHADYDTLDHLDSYKPCHNLVLSIDMVC